MRQGACQIRKAGRRAGRRIDRQCFDLRVLEDLVDEVAQPAPRSNLDKRAHAVGVHLLHRTDKLDRGGDLPPEQGAQLVGVVGVASPGGVGVRYHTVARRDLYTPQRGRKWLRRASHQLRMKSRCHRQSLCGDTTRLERARGTLDLLGGSR